MTTTNASLAAAVRIIRSRATRSRVGHHMSIIRRHAVLDALVARVNGSLVTAASYLAALGADRAFIDRYAAAFGTKVSQAYQAEFGRKSARTALARRGLRLFTAFAYTADELPVLDKAARAYNRTSDLIAA